MTVQTKIIRLGPAKARELLANQIKNRPVRKGHVKDLAEEMSLGRWSLNGQGITIDSRGRLIDGQHRCHAVIESGIEIEILCTTGVDPAVFDLIDRGAQRNISDVIAGTPNYRIVAAALRLLAREANGLALSHSLAVKPRDARLLLEKTPDIITSASWVAGHSWVKAALGCGVAAYANWKTTRLAPEAAPHFWEPLDSGAGLASRSPVLCLRNALIDAGNGRQFSESHRLALVIIAWNKFRARQSTKFIRYSPNAGQDYPQWGEG
jgi:hypothetical protein